MSTSDPHQKTTFSTVVQHFAPGWFAAVMGTGALAITSFHFGREVPLLGAWGWFLHYANFLLFAVLAVPWLGRWLFRREAALATLRHPVQAFFYPTFSIALLILAAQSVVFHGPSNGALVLWWAGALLTYGFSFLVLFHVFRGEHIALDHVTPGMYIPPVGLVVIPMAGGPLLPIQPEALRELATVVNVLGLGAGMGMYVSFLALTLFRFVLHKPVQGMLTPTVWIQLAPIGVIVVSLLNLVEQMPGGLSREPFVVFALLLWGFGVWWSLMCLFLTAAARRAGQLPFALSWWAFTFPLGAFVAASLRLSSLTQWSSIWSIGFAAYLLLNLFWVVTLVHTLRGVRSGKLFQAH